MRKDLTIPELARIHKMDIKQVQDEEKIYLQCEGWAEGKKCESLHEWLCVTEWREFE
jgi:hypothetical protein